MELPHLDLRPADDRVLVIFGLHFSLSSISPCRMGVRLLAASGRKVREGAYFPLAWEAREHEKSQGTV